MLSRIIVSGEGATDFGEAKNEQPIATNDDFEKGPLFLLLLKLIDQHLPEWNKDQELIKIFIYRKVLGDLAKASPVRLPSKDKATKGHLEHTKRAYALALKAKEISAAHEDHIAVYFHDTDGTQAELLREPDRQENRVAAINLGFATAAYQTGVAMVPKPTSEAWLYCSCKVNPYQHCQRIEIDLSGNNGFELLDHAQDVAEDLGLDRNHIVELKLAGNKDEELYRHLLLGQCHKLHEAMPFLFEALDDETELLLPDNLTRTDSILRGLVDNIPEEDWQQVEIIGWLYQFYISEKKDQVIGSVVKSEDIPAATQLFTPNWIVKYLVQNSVGRQWLMTYPDSNLKTQMEYYIEPAEQDSSVKAALAAITPASIEPESIKVIDPACGSGHNADFNTLQRVLALFGQAKTFGSLIQVPADKAGFLRDLKNQLQPLIKQGDSYQKPAAAVLLPFVHQAWLLAQRYEAVIANPPYMGGKGMNSELKVFAQKYFSDSKSDLFAMFMERAFDLLKDNGYNAQVNMQSWMFLSSYQVMREKLIDKHTFITMAHLGARAFGQISGEVVQTTAFVLAKNHTPYYRPTFFRLIEGNEEVKCLAMLNKENAYNQTEQDDFKKIPGNPIAYWVSEKIINVFAIHRQIYECSISEGQNITADNDKYLRLWWEVDKSQVEPAGKWSFYSKGGTYRKWFGNLDYVIDWSEDARKHYYAHSSARIIPKYLRFREGITWTLIASSNQSFRFLPNYATFDKGGSSIFFNDPIELRKCLLFLNTKISAYLTKLFNATLNLQVDDVRKLPLSPSLVGFDDGIYKGLVDTAKSDWDSYETSWDFMELPLLNGLLRVKSDEEENLATNYSPLATKLREAYNKLKANWQEMILEMQLLEQENNRLFIDAYGLQDEDEIKPDVPLEQITLTINPKYRYGGNLSDEELDQRFQSDTLAELVSYGLGCMMGRYRIDKPGLIYAHEGNVDFESIYNGYTAHSSITPNPFIADDDGIIPLTDQEWFKDDATNRFRDFVRTVWGEENLQSNLDFVAESLCLSVIKPKKSESSLETIRRYLSTQFYKDHLKTYKKRPIYWLFSSGKQKAFECLVYLHRYNESTLPRMRTEYVTPLLGKYDSFAAQLNKQLEDATTSEGTQLKKELVALEKKQTELRAFDDHLKHYADMRIKLDLDDGVKVNYGKFGDLLVEVKAITGGKE